jgi:preprotein translocase subunit SecE
MSKQTATATYWGELGRSELYKKNQGRLTRRLTAVGLVLILGFGAWTLYQGPLVGSDRTVRMAVPLAIVMVGLWAIFRLINWPRFADFLISVEAEVDKVSWASKQELFRATVVVIVTMFFLAFLLFACDLFWVWLFRELRVLQT